MSLKALIVDDEAPARSEQPTQQQYQQHAAGGVANPHIPGVF